MNDRIKIKSDWSGYENKIPDTTQEGIESEINLLLGPDQKFSILSHFAKSRTDTGGPNSRRPDLSYGFDYENNFNIIDDYQVYLPAFFSLVSSSNLADIKDIEEDKINNVNTIPVLYGKDTAYGFSVATVLLSFFIFLNHNLMF